MDEWKIVVGLGNPGPEYEQTRHNLGFEAVGLLSVRHGIGCNTPKFRALCGSGRIAGFRVHLVKPMTFMNESGIAVREVMDWYRCELPQVLVICDDVNLPLGKTRVRRDGSCGGHKGLASIEKALGTDEYSRLRMGVGPAEGPDMRDFVLSRFREDERNAATESCTRAADAAETWIRYDVETCMNQFN